MTAVEDVPVAGAQATEILSVRGLSVAYETGQGLVNAVSDVSLDVHRDEIVAVIGESGSGKSSLARGILGLLPAAGRVTGGSVEITSGERRVDLLRADRSEIRNLRGSGIGFVPQATGGALNPVQRVSAHFQVTLRSHGVPWRRGGRERAELALAEAGLPDTATVLHAYPHELSGGMAQRVVLALASVLSPSALVADEPTSALDVTVQRTVLDRIAANVRASHRGAMIITHDIRIARKYCDSVMVMYGGYAVETGPTQIVLDTPRHPYTKALLAAIPGPPEHGRRRVRSVARTESAAASPDACPFYAACPERSDPRCADQVPPPRLVAPGHYVRSFYG